jgi:hypothetical protein
MKCCLVKEETLIVVLDGVKERKGDESRMRIIKQNNPVMYWQGTRNKETERRKT